MTRTLSRRGAILLGGLVAGTLDITYAIVFWAAFRRTRPTRILQSVASGLLGSRSYQGGAGTAALGLLLHFFIALSAATIFCLATPRLGLRRRAVLVCGVVYGIAVYAVMNYIVIPLSAFPGKAPTRPLVVVTGLLVHMFLIGLPIAWFYRRSLLKG